MGSSFWSSRPTRSGALVTVLAAGLAALGLALAAERASPTAVRARLPLERGGLDEFFLTEIGEEPGRVLMTSRRENSTWTRDRASQAGDLYWIRRYGDPDRPGLPERVLLTSRTRGAHLYVPLGALDLERDLAEPVEPPAAESAAPAVRSELCQLYLNRSFAGVYLHLRFPKRPLIAEGPEAGDAVDFDLVVVRGNELRTTDFLLQPNARLYGSALADGLMPEGDFRRNAPPGELVLVLWDDGRAPESLQVPLSLFDELGRCWGGALPTIVDDRWRTEALPAFALRPPSDEQRARAAWNGALHLAASFEEGEERRALTRALERFGRPGT